MKSVIILIASSILWFFTVILESITPGSSGSVERDEYSAISFPIALLVDIVVLIAVSSAIISLVRIVT